MIGSETRMLLRHHLAQGMSKSALARQLGISRDTIHRWIRSGDLDRDLSEPVRFNAPPPRPSKLDPFKPIILARLEAFEELSAVRLFEEVRAAGYSGSYNRVKHFVRAVRPRPAPEPIVRFETPPGHQAQVDFAEFRFPWGKRYALLVVLGYSRLLWLRFFERQDMRALILGLEEAFAYFGGVPRELLFDQMKAVITRDLRLQGGQLVRNEEFLRYATHWGFTPRACRPYRAQTKGKVERPVSYVRGNFVYGRDFIGDAHLDDERLRWLEYANGRIHGTTKEIPRERFERDERTLLQPLAARPYHSLTLLPATGAQPAQRSRVPRIAVERRPLSAYSAIAAAGGGR